ncbi:MAG: hypothetical protein K2J32_03320 [Ruminococcus sp.]|nr:hypothetical protein [Ruminococcus sp.]
MSVFNNREYNTGRFGKNADIPPAMNNNKNISPPVRSAGNSINSLLEIFSGDNQDSDKLLILALMFLLIKDGADMKLILALAYILL